MIIIKPRLRTKIFLSVLSIALIGALTVFAINIYMLVSTEKRIVSPSDAASLEDIDCVLVLGCLVKNDGSPSDMLNDRLIVGTELYFNGTAKKLLMSGDHSRTDYNEVGTMKSFAESIGIPSSDIFMDHAGFSTYESIYRAKEIFGAKKIVIVTQKYHLSRALYIAKSLGVEAYGVSADVRGYSGQAVRDMRELLARVKDFTISITKPEPTYLGDKIPISGDGNATNDY